MPSGVVRRPSLPLTGPDEEGLGQIRGTPAYRAALERLSGQSLEGVSVSEAALLHAIFEAGLAAVRAEAEANGYAEIAASQDPPTRQALARRRTPSWAVEA